MATPWVDAAAAWTGQAAGFGEGAAAADVAACRAAGAPVAAASVAHAAIRWLANAANGGESILDPENNHHDCLLATQKNGASCDSRELRSSLVL